MTDEEFVQAWNSGVSTPSLAKTLRISNTSVYQKLRILRTKGYEVAHRPSGRARKPTITDQEFIQIWNASPTAKLASVAVNMNKSATYQRSQSLRQQGYELKVFTTRPRGANKARPVLPGKDVYLVKPYELFNLGVKGIFHDTTTYSGERFYNIIIVDYTDEGPKFDSASIPESEFWDYWSYTKP